MGKFVNAEEIISKRYGEKGSKERDKFNRDAYVYYFGEILKDRRKELKMTQATLAEKVRKKRPYISRIENDEDLYLSNFTLLTNALAMSIELKIE